MGPSHSYVVVISQTGDSRPPSFLLEAFPLHTSSNQSFISYFLNIYHLFIPPCPPGHNWLIQEWVPDPRWVSESFFLDIWTWKQEEYLASLCLILNMWDVNLGEILVVRSSAHGESYSAAERRRLSWHVEGSKQERGRTSDGSIIIEVHL